MIPAPPALSTPPGQPFPPAEACQRLAELMGIPYLPDGVEDAAGRWCTFTHPDRFHGAPGLNCSGFLVAASRRLLGFRGSPSEAGRDRLANSGPEAAAGPDWDFGWDLLLNLSEGHARRWLGATGPLEVDPSQPGVAMAFAVQEGSAWQAFLPRLQPHRVYLGSLIRSRSRGRLQFHHVVLLLRDSRGMVWLYQTLPRGRVHRLPLGTPAGLARFQGMFGPSHRLLVLEVTP